MTIQSSDSGQSGTWSDAADWSSAVIPTTSTDEAIINGSDAGIVNGPPGANSVTDASTFTDNGALAAATWMPANDLAGESPTIGISTCGQTSVDYQPVISAPLVPVPGEGNGGTTIVTSFALAISAIPPVGAVAAHGASAAAPADLASVADSMPASPQVSTAATSSTDSIGSAGATRAQLQQALGESGLSVNGAGITIGVISNSFNALGGAPQDEADGALPPASQIHVIVPAIVTSSDTDEGRAMMQVAYDVAPGATLDFAAAGSSQQAEANSILALAAAGCKVICDDAFFYNEPMFQLGVVSQAIQTVEAEGVIYVTAAGNNGSLDTGYGAYQANWTPISGSFDGYNLTNAQSVSGSVVQSLTVGGSSSQVVTLSLDWGQPLGEATANLEILAFSGGKLVATATNSSSGNAGNPIVTLGLTADATYQIAIVDMDNVNPGGLKLIVVGDGISTTLSGANVGTIFGHAMTPGAITVGAVSSTDTPAFGVNPAINEPFSSSGYEDQFLFNNNGTPLASPDVISPVQISGVDNVNTTVPGNLTDFQGTSCATPTVAATVALMLQANPNLTLAQVDSILQATASPMANSYVSGAGLVQVDAAVGGAMALETATTAQIDDIYQAILQRAPTGAELSSWLAPFPSTGITVISGVVDSTEAQFNVYPIVQIIQLATGILPTAEQLGGWVPFIEQIGPLQGQAQTNPLLDEMATAFVASTQFGNTYNNGVAVDPNSVVTAQEMQVIIKAATGVAATQAQINTWVGTGLTIDEVFVDFALGDQYTTFAKGAVQQYLASTADTALATQLTGISANAVDSSVAHA